MLSLFRSTLHVYQLANEWELVGCAPLNFKTEMGIIYYSNEKPLNIHEIFILFYFNGKIFFSPSKFIYPYFFCLPFFLSRTLSQKKCYNLNWERDKNYN